MFDYSEAASPARCTHAARTAQAQAQARAAPRPTSPPSWPHSRRSGAPAQVTCPPFTAVMPINVYGSAMEELFHKDMAGLLVINRQIQSVVLGE